MTTAASSRPPGGAPDTGPDSAPDGGARNRAMIEALRAAGLLTDPGITAALAAVPRHRFAPARGWLAPDRGTGAARPIDWHTDPTGWWDAVYSDGSIVTQRDDGASPPDTPSGTPSSSLSAPGVVSEFLELLAARPGDRVLEIGTGTGWTAALLARLGADVTSVEVDTGVAEQAAENLRAAALPPGAGPRLVVGDGAAGAPAHARYDRVHSTCAVARVPGAWIEQTRPGGIIVTPWQPMPGVGWKLRLTVQRARGRGGVRAVGGVHGPAGYMMLRAHRTAARWNPHHAAHADTILTRLDPRVFARPGTGLALTVAARCPGIGIRSVVDDGDGSFSLLLFEAGDPDGAWAACDTGPAGDSGADPGGAGFEVTQYGARRLWDEVEAAHAWWTDQGQPGEDRFDISIGPCGDVRILLRR